MTAAFSNVAVAPLVSPMGSCERKREHIWTAEDFISAWMLDAHVEIIFVTVGELPVKHWNLVSPMWT